MSSKILLAAVFCFCVVLPSLHSGDAAFETASVKRAAQCSMRNSIDPSRVALMGDPVSVLLSEAFDVKPDQIDGPSWPAEDCFTVIATIPAGAAKDQLPAMFQSLLAERFHLAYHKETRRRAGYALTIDKGGVKFKESAPGLNGARVSTNRVVYGASASSAGIKGSITMAALARYLSGKLKAPVEDDTALPSKYDIDVTWTPDPTIDPLGPFAQQAAPPAPSTPSGAPNLFTALRDTLGLKLESRNQPVDFLVIDRIDRTPVEN